MNCKEVMERLEEYIMEEVDTETRQQIDNHLLSCLVCKREYKEMKEVIGGIRSLKKSLRVNEEVLAMNKKNILEHYGRKKFSFTRLIPSAAACLFFAATLTMSSIIAFPAFASNYAPGLPVVKQLVQAQKENSEVKKQIEDIRKENDSLKLQIKKIQDTQIVEVPTSTPANSVSQEERMAVQNLVIDFIKAEYRGDIDLLESLCTESGKRELKHMVANKKGKAVFSTITDVAKENGKYLVFVRLTDTDSQEKQEAEYQQNFEIVREAGKYLVAFVGMDA